MEVSLDVAADDPPEGADELVDLPRVGASDGVGDTDAVDADLVDGSVEVEEVDEVGAERVLGGETDLDALGLDKLDDWGNENARVSCESEGGGRGRRERGRDEPSMAVRSM